MAEGAAEWTVGPDQSRLAESKHGEIRHKVPPGRALGYVSGQPLAAINIALHQRLAPSDSGVTLRS
ncbi:hypothetical protein GCM10010124_25480 [Pilimelia terevasa]|uniref:Uncharacterized protein n=1 Tax=Pilimelia terevasa TaxID=53372 RepID=A0A8J3FK44_9ACTN|nr:hypothetical protein GCM10010124_25480 [Pilimelia terevasa]